MLDALFNDKVTVRRLSGVRDGHGKPTLKVVVEKDSGGADTDVPVYIDCFIDRRRRNVRTERDMSKSVDATLNYNVDLAGTRLLDEDIVVVESTGEAYRVETMQEQKSAVEGSEYSTIGLLRTKFPVVKDAAPSDEV